MNETKNNNMDYYPLMDAERYTDTSKHIEQDAAAQWIRGGLPSRDIYKNAEYKNILT